MRATWFYDNRQLLALSLLIILVGGLSALISLPRLEDPRIDNRNPVIVTLLPGASAERVEALVTKKLEEELREVSEIKELESDSRAGISFIKIELADEVRNPDEVFTRLRDKLADVESDLPPEATKPEFDDERGAVAFTLIIGVTWQSDTSPVLGVMGRTAEELADRLRNVEGTDLVRVYGEPQEEIKVTLDRNNIAQLGLTVPQIQSIVQQADSKVAAGILRSPNKNIVLEVGGNFRTLDRIADVPLRTNEAGEVVLLRDVAHIEKSWRDPPAEIGLVDGQRSIYVAARMQDNRRVDVWMNDAQAVVSEFRSGLSPKLQLAEVFDQSSYTSERLGRLSTNLLLGAAVVVCVIFVMMGWRSSILVGLALPLVSGMVLFSLLVIGVPLHQMSIFGLIVALGLLIDNAIVVVDDIGADIRQGAEPRAAVSRTIGHLFVPLLGSTLTTVVAFLPIFLLPGSLGEFVGPIATTVILALIFSLFVSLTIIPALAGRFTVAGERSAWRRSGLKTPWMAHRLRKALQLAVAQPALGILFAISIPAVGFLRVDDLRDQFFPAADRNQFHVQVWLPRDASLELTERTARDMEQVIRESAGVVSVNWLVGASIPTVYYNMIMDQDEKPSYTQAVITASSAQRGRELIPELQARLDQQFPQAQTVVKQLGQGPPVDAPVEVRVYGRSVARLRGIGQEIQRHLFETPQVIHTQTTFDAVEPKLWVEADELELRSVGLALTDVASQLQTSMEGTLGGSVLEETEELPVRFRFNDEIRGDVGKVWASRLILPGTPDWMPLSAVGELRLKPQTASIPRRNGERCNTIKAYVEADALAPEVTAAFLKRLESSGYQLPAGYRLEIGGDAEELRSAMANLFRYAPVLAVVMLSTVVLSFRSFLLAGILGTVAALSAGLAFFNLWMADFPLGFNPLIGMAGLIGIALNDSIVVLAQIRTNAHARAGDLDAIVNEVMKTSRHVIATTLTTIGGFVPLLLSGGDFWPPLAIVIAGGVGGASIIALFFVPASYTLVRRFVESERMERPTTQGVASLRHSSSRLKVGAASPLELAQ